MGKTTLSASRTSSRFLFLCLSVIVVNAIVWLAYDCYRRPVRLDLLRIESVQPDGDSLPTGREPLIWKFNLDIADRAGSSVRANDPAAPVRIKPAVDGTFDWPDARTLRFTPDAPLPKATGFSFTLPSYRLHSVEGHQLAETFALSRSTDPLRLETVRQVDFDEQGRATLELTFNDVVLPNELSGGLSARSEDGNGKPVRLHVVTAPLSNVLRVQCDALPGNQWQDGSLKLTLAAGLHSRSGPIGLSHTTDYTVAISPDRVLLELRAGSYRDEDASLFLRFNGQVDLEKLRPLISIQPVVDGLRFDSNYDGIVLRGKFQPATRYAVTIANSVVDGPRNKLMPRPGMRTVFVPDRTAGAWFDTPRGYLGASGHRTVHAHAMNASAVRVGIFRLHKVNIPMWRNYFGAQGDIEDKGPEVASKTIKLNSAKNVRCDVELLLDELIPAALAGDGVYSLNIVPVTAARTDADEGYPSSDQTLVTLSDIGLSAHASDGRLLVMALSLHSAKPLPATHVAVYSQKNQVMGEGQTDASGLADIRLNVPGAGEEPAVVLAERTGEGSSPGLSWLDLTASESHVEFGEVDTSGRPYLRHGYEAFIYRDRGVYRPGEVVRLRAIVRGARGAVPSAFPVRWTLRGPDGRVRDGATTTLDSDGATTWDAPTYNDTATGFWNVSIGRVTPDAKRNATDEFGTDRFQLEDFVPDRMKVALELATKAGNKPARAKAGQDVTARLQGDYLFGQPAAGLQATLITSITPVTFSSAAWGGWTFGDAGEARSTASDIASLARTSPEHSATLDTLGHVDIPLPVAQLIGGQIAADEEINQPTTKARHVGPWLAKVSASVLETGGRAITRQADVLIDPADCYLGLHVMGKPPLPGEHATIETALVTPAGSVSAQDAQLQIRLFRVRWNNTLLHENGRYVFHTQRILEPAGKKPVDTVDIAHGHGRIDLTIPDSGTFVLVAEDAAAGLLASLPIQVNGGAWDESVNCENPEKIDVTITPASPILAGMVIDTLASVRSKLGPSPELLQNWRDALARRAANPAACRYRAGEWVNAVINSPFRGTLLLTVETDRVISTRIVEMTANHLTVPMQLNGDCRPNAYVCATVIRGIDSNAAWRSHRAHGLAVVSMDETDRHLNVSVQATSNTRPAQSLPVLVRITDAHGNAIPNAAVTVSAVDEGICQLTAFRTPDPFNFFSAKRSLSTSWNDLYGQLVPDGARAGRNGDIGGDEDVGGDRHAPSVAARRVKPVALASAVLRADSDGFARVSFNLPLFFGQLRVIAVAYAGDAYGGGDVPVTVKSPLMVQTSWPRFVAPGDQFSVPVTVFNNTPNAAPVKVEIALTADAADLAVPASASLSPLSAIQGKAVATDPSLLSLASGQPAVWTSPVIRAGGQLTMEVGLVASRRAGVAHAVIVASAADERATDEMELPVRPASPKITTGDVVVATPSHPVSLSLPNDFLPGSGKYEIRISPGPQMILPQGLDYLDTYPHGCAEQTTSGCFPLVFLSDLREKIGSVAMTESAVKEKIDYGLAKLATLQTSSGGLGMWPGDREHWPWASVYAAHFVVVAEKAGYRAQPIFRTRLLDYVRSLLDRSDDQRDNLEIQAYACFVLALAGEPDRSAMNRLAEILDTPALEPQYTPSNQMRFHLSAAFLASGNSQRAKALIPRTLPVPLATRQRNGNIASPVRDRAVLLQTLLSVVPDHPAIPGLVEALLSDGRAGRWRSTQDTAFAIMALGQYMRANKSAQPYSSAELREADRLLIRGDGTRDLQWSEPVAAYMPAATTQPALRLLQVNITGPQSSKAYISWLATGVPMSPPAPLLDQGLIVSRCYLDQSGNTLDPKMLTSGQLVWVELRVTAQASIDGIVVEDLLPAGLEIENPRLLGSASADQQRKPRATKSHRRTSGRHITLGRPNGLVRLIEDVTPDDSTFNSPPLETIHPEIVQDLPWLPITRMDIRDDRLVLFGNLPGGTTYRHLYLARAVTAGDFVAPPLRAECMYDIATRGLGQTLHLIVRPATAKK